jgi:hypothetical protein
MMETICLETSESNYPGTHCQIHQKWNLKIQSAADIPADNRLFFFFFFFFVVSPPGCGRSVTDF